MRVKYNNQENFHYIENYEFINIDRVRLVGKDIPESTSGFNVYDDFNEEVGFDIVLYMNPEHIVVYDKGENFIEYTKDTTVYHVFYIMNKEGYITKAQSFTTKELPEDMFGVFYKSGQGKEFVEPITDLILIDEEGFYNYKIVDGEIVEVSEEEKDTMRTKRNEAKFSTSLKIKLSEIATICSENIVKGIDYNGEHYSYEITDQNNIESAVNLASATGLDIPYHANGKPCRLYAPEEIVAIYVINETNLTHHTTYSNQLKLYAETLKTKEEVESIKYGQTLTDEYLETYTMIMSQSKKIIAAFLKVDEVTVDAILNSSITMTEML
jgi:hypothetical protein